MSVRVWKIDREAILARLTRWARELGEQDENVMAVVLFGSLARGDHTAASDADVLIILRESTVRFDERIPAFMPSNIGVGVDVFPYTLSETKRALEEGWGVARIALKEGMFLFQRKGELATLQNPAITHKGQDKNDILLYREELATSICLT